MNAGWIYQIIKAFLDFFRETPPTDVQHGHLVLAGAWR